MANERPPANEFVRQIMDNELQAEQNDHSHWMLRLQTQESGKIELREVVETKDDWFARWPMTQYAKSAPLNVREGNAKSSRVLSVS